MRYDSCRQCTKRRIKCDQGIPRCAKCIKKGLECSGSGKTYRFVGNKTPDTILASSSARSRHGKPRNDEGEVLGTSVCSSVSSPSSAQHQDEAGPQTVQNVLAARTTEYSLSYPVALYKPGRAMLLDHFARVIAPYMTISNNADVDNNGYRNLILPLAHEDPLVQRAVMVVSAFHLGTQRNQNELRQQAEMGRAAILARLRQDVMRGSVEHVLNVSTWATLVILLVGETVTGSPDFVRLFSMLGSLTCLQNGNPLGSRGLSTFLDYQRRMFLFMTPPLLGATEPIEPWSGSEDLYFEFFDLSPSIKRSHHRNVAIIKEAFKTVHTLTMQQNNALLPEEAVKGTLDALRTLVAPLTRTMPGAHTLVWVFFIAAAESRTEGDRMFFSQRLGELYDIGRFGNIPVALGTLDRIWALDPWRRWTRETDMIAPVLVI